MPCGQTLFVANSGNSTVTTYAAPYTGTPTATISAGISEPKSLGVNAAGNLFVANGGNNSITEYAPPYTGAPIATITNGISECSWGIAVDSHGNLFAGTVNSIVEYASPYTGAPTVISNGIANPEFVIDTALDLFVLNQPSNEPCCGTFSLRKYAPPYTGSPVVTANFDGNMVGLALNAAGDVFVTSF